MGVIQQEWRQKLVITLQERHTLSMELNHGKATKWGPSFPPPFHPVNDFPCIAEQNATQNKSVATQREQVMAATPGVRPHYNLRTRRPRTQVYAK